MVQNANYYTLENDIFLVSGYAKACLYDLQKGFLYNISHKVRDVITILVEEKNGLEKLSSTDLEIASFLIESKIIFPSKLKKPLQDILDLRQKKSISFSWIEITRKCNLKCTFCYEESGPECYEKMKLDEFILIAKNLVEAGVEAIQFIGGEPMILGNTLKEMIRYARPLFKFIEVYTNGVFIDKSWAIFFKEQQINVALSVHSYNAKEHDKVTTVTGSHKKVTDGIAFLKEFEVPFRVSAVKTSSCEIGTPAEDSLYSIREDNVRLSGRGKFSQYTYEMFSKKAITKKTKSGPISKQSVTTHVSGHQCFLKEIYVGVNLDVFPCVMERRFVYGNLKKDKLTDIIDNEVRYLSKDHIEGCKNCEYRYHCFDCRPDSNGLDKLKKPWYCSYNPYTGEWAELETMFRNLQKGIFHPSVDWKVEATTASEIR